MFEAANDNDTWIAMDRRRGLERRQGDRRVEDKGPGQLELVSDRRAGRRRTAARRAGDGADEELREIEATRDGVVGEDGWIGDHHHERSIEDPTTAPEHGWADDEDFRKGVDNWLDDE